MESMRRVWSEHAKAMDDSGRAFVTALEVWLCCLSFLTKTNQLAPERASLNFFSPLFFSLYSSSSSPSTQSAHTAALTASAAVRNFDLKRILGARVARSISVAGGPRLGPLPRSHLSIIGLSHPPPDGFFSPPLQPP